MFTEKYLSRASRSNAGTKKESSEESTLVRGVIPLEMEGGDSKVVELKVHTFPAENEWYHSSLLLLADIVGSGILALSGAFSKMGWFFGFLLLILCCPLNMYTGILLARLRKHHPLVTTYGELGESLFGKKVGYACYAILYIYIFFVLGEYMVVMSRSIQGVFYNTDMCRPVAGILSCLILFISNQARTLRNIAFLSIVSFVTIFIVLTICLHDIENDGVVPDSKHDIVRGVVVCSSSFMEYH